MQESLLNSEFEFKINFDYIEKQKRTGTKESFFSFDYDFYLDKFRIIKRKFIYPRFCFLFEWLANSWPRFHEIILRKFLPVKDIYFKLQVKKQ